ncbi:MAG: rod shape-determining protein MreC [Gemmatimonadales bacterium]|nr:MAG: rod shape-determining protein MreC [Gemmatimonadales bacterium]
MPSFEQERFENGGRRELWLSLLFLLLAGVLIALPSRAQEQVATALRSTVLSPFLLMQESLVQTRIRAEDVADLQERLDAAAATLAAQSTLREENERLRDLLQLRERAGPDFRSASVLRSGIRGSESMLLLDVGGRDGVAVNDPVVTAQGLVGLIRESGSSRSVAMDWTHPDFSVSVMTLDGGAFGMVEPRSGAFREEDRLILTGVPYYTTLDPGTAVVTSGRGSVYPRGILVGTIQELASTEAGWMRSYWLQPAVRPAGVNQVLVLTGDPASGSAEDETGLEGLWFDPEPEPDTAGVGPDGGAR